MRNPAPLAVKPAGPTQSGVEQAASGPCEARPLTAFGSVSTISVVKNGALLGQAQYAAGKGEVTWRILAHGLVLRKTGSGLGSGSI